MARRRDKRNIPSVPVKAVIDKAESYEGDDEGRDESPPVSPVIVKGKLDNGPSDPQLDSSEAKFADITESAKESSKKSKKTAKLNNGVATEESEPTPESSKKNKKGAKLDNGIASAEAEPAVFPAKKSRRGKSKKEEEFEVEQVVGMEVNFRWQCPVRFRVRWVGYTEKDDTWVSVNNLNCENVVEDFLSISGRTSEYEKAMERAQKPSQVNMEYRESLRKRGRPEYCEDSDEGEEVLLTTSTRTRKTRRPDMFDPADARPQLLKINRKKAPKVGVSRAHALAQQAGREYEVVLITDHRVKGRFTEYKVRWKGLTSVHDSWVPEANLTCPKLIADYLKSIKSEPEQEYEVAAIIDSREVDGAVSYKVRWKGFSAKFDSWLPKDEMNCPEMIKKFEDALEKLNKKEDWVVKRIRAERERSGKVEYLVNWNGFESKFDTWEPSANLEGCQEKLDQFFAWKEKKKKKTTQNKDDDQSDEEKSKESDEEEITVKKSKNKRKKGPSLPAKPSPAAQSKDSRKRRITLPVSYDEDDDLSE